MSLRGRRIRALRQRLTYLRDVLIPTATAEGNTTLSYKLDEAEALQWVLEGLESQYTDAEAYASRRVKEVEDGLAAETEHHPSLHDLVARAFLAGCLTRQSLQYVIGKALEVLVRYGATDGAHHKAWVIDQVVRILAAQRYEGLVAAARAGKNGPETFAWDVGVPP